MIALTIYFCMAGISFAFIMYMLLGWLIKEIKK